MTKQKCIICDRRPARTDKGYCYNCASQIEADKKHRQTEKPVKFLTYRGHVVGLFKNGDGTLTAKLLKRGPEGLPKGITLDLNTYLEGFTREQVKRFKSCCLKLANA